MLIEAITDFIQKHQGRIVGTAGDSVLAEFASVVDAVRCAVEIQEEVKARNSNLPEDRKMEFRIGVNLEDVVEEAITVAARVQGESEAGGICISPGQSMTRLRISWLLAMTMLESRWSRTLRSQYEFIKCGWIRK
jgi:class 3 adenylate cyclase